MEQNVKEIIGLRTVEGKNGEYQLIYYIEPFTDYEKDGAKSCVGMKVGNEYSRKVFKDLKVGDKVKFYYDKGFEDKAILSDVVIVPFDKK